MVLKRYRMSENASPISDGAMDSSKISTAISVGEKFAKLYYDHCEKMRHKLRKLYHDEGVLVWNGNQICGAEKIQCYYLDLPSANFHVNTIDSQPVSGTAVEDNATILVTTTGFVTFDIKKSPFQQTFIITIAGENWKIVSDTFRFQTS